MGITESKYGCVIQFYIEQGMCDSTGVYGFHFQKVYSDSLQTISEFGLWSLRRMD